MQSWRHVQPSGTNCPKFRGTHENMNVSYKSSLWFVPGTRSESDSSLGFQPGVSSEGHSGDDSIRAPPLPIPNREVKPYHADGTAKAEE